MKIWSDWPIGFRLAPGLRQTSALRRTHSSSRGFFLFDLADELAQVMRDGLSRPTDPCLGVLERPRHSKRHWTTLCTTG